jgi:serine protease Do
MIAVLLLASDITSAEEGQTPAAIAPNLPYSLAPLIELSAPAVVNIYTRKILHSRSAAGALNGAAFWRLFRDTLLFGYGQDRVENSLGSGVIVAANGTIVTNEHVVEDADGIIVALTDGRIFEAEVLISDKRSDVAVLQIRADGPLPFIEFGDSDELRVGDRIIAIGNPFSLGQTVTTGIVSALARTTFGVGDFRFFIQTDAAINPGNSGGAQIDLSGKLVGINTAIYSTSGGSQGLGFAIPSNMVRSIVESAVEHRPLVHPWIGISAHRIPPQFASALGLAGTHGILVTNVYKGGPAEAAGFSAGDVILAVNAVSVDEPQALRYRIAMLQVGVTARLLAMRGGRRFEAPVTVVAPPEVPARDDTWLSNLSPLRGARVASLSPALAEEIGADSGIAGVIVRDVGQASAAARVGLRVGDIIRSYNDQEISTVAELMEFRAVPFTPWHLTVNRVGVDIVLGRPSTFGSGR